MKNLFKNLFALWSIVALSTCGGGGGGSGSGMEGVSFSVSLKSVDVRRVSNGNGVAVDTSGITSGTLTWIQSP